MEISTVFLRPKNLNFFQLQGLKSLIYSKAGNKQRKAICELVIKHSLRSTELRGGLEKDEKVAHIHMVSSHH